MAKHRGALAARPSVIVMAPPRRGGRIRRAASRGLRAAHRGARRGARHSLSHLPMAGVALGGVVAGYLKGRGFLDKLPVIGGSPMVTLGLAGWAVARYVPNRHAKLAGVAMLATAAFDFGRNQAGGTSGLEEGPFGEEVLSDSGQF